MPEPRARRAAVPQPAQLLVVLVVAEMMTAYAAINNRGQHRDRWGICQGRCERSEQRPSTYHRGLVP